MPDKMEKTQPLSGIAVESSSTSDDGVPFIDHAAESKLVRKLDVSIPHLN
jgi:hypothetical protein